MLSVVATVQVSARQIWIVQARLVDAGFALSPAPPLSAIDTPNLTSSGTNRLGTSNSACEGCSCTNGSACKGDRWSV